MKNLELLFNDKNDFNKKVFQKSTTVRRPFYSLAKFGMKPNGVDSQAQAFLYLESNVCLELPSLNCNTINKIDVIQNNMIRYTLGLEFKCRTSNVLSALEIFTIEQLYQINMLTNVKLLHHDETSKYILKRV